MAGQPIAFPTSTQPSLNATENGGRLINAFAEAAPPGSRSQVILRSVPGLNPAFIVGVGAYRGSLLVNGVLYVCNGASVYTVVQSGANYIVTALTGALPGTGLVMMERNMRSPTPQIQIVHSAGISQIIAGVVSDFSDVDLPSVVSVTFLDGYFVWATADGRAFSSGLNDITVAGTDFATAEASPDGLVRAVAYGRDLLLMGDNSTEFWADVGNPTGFPFSRGPVIPLGLFGIRSVAGMDRGFTSDLCFVSNDRRVYRLTGYTPTPISTPEIEALLQAITDPTQLDASVYSISGHSCFVLSSATWTMVYDLSTGNWHERQSINTTRWRAQGGINAFNTWLAFERGGNQVYFIDPLFRRENASQLIWEVRSTQAHRFPGRFVVNRASFDMVTGVGLDRGVSPIESDPVVMIDWSDDGGKTFGEPRVKPLGTQGELVSIDAFRCGLTKQLGRQWRARVSDPVVVSLMGAAMDIEPRSA